MPRLLTDKKKSPGPKKKLRFSVPHSPFQKLIDGARLKKELSILQLARLVKPNLNRGSLWIWLHNENGYPSRRSATPERLESLSTVLGVPLPQIKAALDESRLLYGTKTPMPSDAKNAMEQFIEVIENDSRTYISKAKVLNLAKRLYAGANSEISRVG